ncbi:hypothetical protein [Oligoflexus tunisiensis]|uniref:hypothetical protein n=1 Tax=Oligoflexus tunisiensis TaxID=708132 RepID=UPI000B22DCD2|nr:hypothetical protein [Oligoflexus tunisiensis]
MKRKVIAGVLVLVGVTYLGFQKLSGKDPVPSEAASQPSASEPKPEEISAKDLDRTIEVLKKVEAPSLEKVAEELQASGDEEALETFHAYREQQKTYDAVYAKYEAAHAAYRQAVHAAPDANSPEVEAALAAVDAEAEALQAETDALNAKSAEFLEEYRRYTFDKFGLALN